MRPSGLFASCSLSLTTAVGGTAATLLNDTLGLGRFHHHLEQAASSALVPSDGTPVEFWNCDGFDGEKAGFVVKEIALSPNPPVRGQDLDITIRGDLREKMDAGASVKVTVWKWGHAFTTLTYDWCQNIQGIACPVQPGPVTFSKTQDIDPKIPPLKFTLAVETFNKAGDQISCLLLKDDFVTSVKKEHLIILGYRDT